MLRKARLPVILLVVPLLLLTSSLVAQGQAPVLYSGIWRSGIGIKNLADSENMITVYFYDASTGTKQAYEYSTTLGAGAGIELYLPNVPESELASGSYNVEVQSVGPVGVMATNTDYDANLADSYNGMVSATEFFVPGIYHNHNYWTSNLIVQNVNDTDITGSFEISGIDLVTQAPVGPKTFTVSIPAHTTRSIDTATDSPINFDAELGDHFLGSAKVTAGGSAMAVVLFNTRVSGSSQVVLSYRGMTTADDADTFLVAPIVYRNFNNGWRSGIKVQNVDAASAVSVRLVIKGLGSAVTVTGTQTIEAGKSFEWFLPSTGIFDGGASLPDQFIGSGAVEVISGSGKIVGTVTTTNYDKPKTLTTPPPGVGVALGYIMPSRSGGKSTLSAPTVYKNFGTGIWNSSLVVSNVGTVPVNLALGFAADPGCTTYNQTLSGFALDPGQSREFYLPNPAHFNGETIPDGFKGSILVTATSDSGTPMIGGLVQHTNYGRGVATVYRTPGN